MVAMTIMAIVVGVAFSGLRVGLNSWQKGTRALDKIDRRVTVERLLNRQLAVAKGMEFAIEDRKITMFRGSKDRLEFISDYSLADGAGDFRKIDYAFQDGWFRYAEKNLITYVPSDTEDPPTAPLGDFSRLVFHFLGTNERGQPEWVDDWKADMGLPAAVQVEIDDDTFVIALVNR